MDEKLVAESSTIIGRSVDDVGTFVADPKNEPRWHTDILEIKSASDPTSGPPPIWVLGATWLVTVRFMGRREYEVEITGLEEHRRLEITTRTGPMRPVATYRFEPAGGGTRFTRRVELPLQEPMRTLRPLMRRSLQRRNARFVKNLKGLLEQ